jgi:hypothetical protein
MSYTRLPLTGGGFTIVDDDIAKKLKDKNIYKRGPLYYPSIKIKDKFIYLHRFVLRPMDGFEIDHINGDVFDNRRENLRQTTKSENHINRHNHKVGSSGYK